MRRRVSRAERQHKLSNIDEQAKSSGINEADKQHSHSELAEQFAASEELIAEKLAEQFKRFDEAHAIEVPELHKFEQIVASSKLEIARRQKRDLFLFWLAALPLLSVMLWMLGQHTEWFIGVQITAAAAGITGTVVIAARSGRTRAERKQPRWNKN